MRKESLRGLANNEVDVGVSDPWLEQFRHDLRQPLTIASLMLEHVANSPSLESVALARIRESQRQVSWALELLRAQELGEHFVDVVEIGEAIADVVPLATGWCDVSLVRPNRAYVLVDPLELVRATRNLLDNAVHAATSIAGSATVQVTVDRWRGQAVLAVDDSGPGFGRVAPRHGQGLASVRRFAEQWGGSVSAGISPLGGASVELRLPVASPRVRGR
jgi:signal transduction histidine kinase